MGVGEKFGLGVWVLVEVRVGPDGTVGVGVLVGVRVGKVFETQKSDIVALSPKKLLIYRICERIH